MKTYFLPEKKRAEFQRAWGLPIAGSVKTVIKRYNEFIAKNRFALIVTVGDYCSETLYSDIKIFDRLTQRRAAKNKLRAALKLVNPPGTIQPEAWLVIEQAIKERKNILVNGEEDMLVIPAVLLAPENSLVAYGLPNQGIDCVETTPKTKKIFRDFLENVFSE